MRKKIRIDFHNIQEKPLLVCSFFNQDLLVPDHPLFYRLDNLLLQIQDSKQLVQCRSFKVVHSNKFCISYF
jgi:hypothetical protein